MKNPPILRPGGLAREQERTEGLEGLAYSLTNTNNFKISLKSMTQLSFFTSSGGVVNKGILKKDFN